MGHGSVVKGHWSEVKGQRSLVRVSDQRSVVKGHDQGHSQGSVVRVTGQRSRVTGQRSLVGSDWSGVTDQSQWSKSLVKCPRIWRPWLV